MSLGLAFLALLRLLFFPALDAQVFNHLEHDPAVVWVIT